MLGQVADFEPFGLGDGTVRNRLFAHDLLNQGGLAGPITAHQGNTVLSLDIEGDPFIEGVIGKAPSQVIGL